MNLRIIFIILQFIPSVVVAQWVSDIKTESDWEYYLKTGVIDYNSYQLLRELAEGAEIRDTADFIFSTLGISPVEIIDKLEYAGEIRGQAIPPPSPKASSPWSGRFRLGSDIRPTGNESFVYGTVKSRDFASEFKIRDERGNLSTERRYLRFRRNNYSVLVGNFTADIGCGLSIGRFDYRPVSLETNEDELYEFLFPDNSYYNGLKAEFRDRYTIIYSAKKYNDIYKSTFGTSLETGINSFRVGITGVAARLSTSREARTLGSGSIFVTTAGSGLKGEIAYAESGPGVSLQAAGPGLILRGWYYHNSFINPQSSGFAHPDYQSFSVLDSEISFRQPQQGESGFYVNKGIKYRKLELGNAAEFWRNPRNSIIRYNNSLIARYRFSSSVTSRICYTVYNKNDNYYNKLESGVTVTKDYKFESRAYINFRKKAVAKDESKLYIIVTLPLVKSLSLAGRLRWRFDGLFDYFLEERLLLNNDLFLKATYRWNEDLGSDLGVLYIFMENRF